MACQELVDTSYQKCNQPSITSSQLTIHQHFQDSPSKLSLFDIMPPPKKKKEKRVLFPLPWLYSFINASVNGSVLYVHEEYANPYFSAGCRKFKMYVVC